MNTKLLIKQAGGVNTPLEKYHVIRIHPDIRQKNKTLGNIMINTDKKVVSLNTSYMPEHESVQLMAFVLDKYEAMS